jgi:hypothetical protein
MLAGRKGSALPLSIYSSFVKVTGFHARSHVFVKEKGPPPRGSERWARPRRLRAYFRSWRSAESVGDHPGEVKVASQAGGGRGLDMRLPRRAGHN